MNPLNKAIKELVESDVVRKRLAKMLVHSCFRNTEIENYHADGKLSQKDMKTLNIEAVNKLYTFLHMLQIDDYRKFVIKDLEVFDPMSQWNEPKLLKKEGQMRIEAGRMGLCI